ncbi:MAG TPA: hypothetical protein VFC03_07855, partial [Acidimicrobiales bacterium]|nr:hypothetical protein [Acidimicrobiales bacterium]
VYLLRHTAGDDAISFVERIDPVTLEPVVRSPDLAGGPTWPGSLAAHANGSLYVVFGNHAHRLEADLSVAATTTLPRTRPYNGFVVMPDGCLVTKDFAGSRPGAPVAPGDREPCELVALEPDRLGIVDRCALAEPSIARLSAEGDDVYVVGDTGLLRVRWNGRLRPDTGFRAPYRTRDGQTYGWDCVLALGAAWFLDNGDGSEGYTGTLRGHGLSTAPLHLVRADLCSGAVTSAEVCADPGGLVANPPLIDTVRSIAVGYDSGNGVMRAFDIGADGALTARWDRHQDHGSHLLLFPDTGELLTGDHDPDRMIDQAVVLDIATGAELARADTDSPLQSVLFPAAGFDHDAYLVTFSTVSHLAVGVPAG